MIRGGGPLGKFIDQLKALGDKCSFCPNPMYDSCIIEGGNNAEKSMAVNCCDAHVREMDADSTAFEKKYAATIDRLFSERSVR